MNITNKNTFHECTSCQMCAAVCPVHAIEINIDSEGFYRPYLDNDKCIDCSLCTKVCYKYDNDIQQTETIENCTLYGAKVLDNDVLKKTASGGIADILARHLISMGYLCIGVTYDSVRSIAYNKIAECEEETKEFRGSKYIQAYTFSAFSDLVKKYRDKKFAVFGLPCQIYAIHKFLKVHIQRDNHILIDMYCHGTPSIIIWQKYIQKIKNSTKSQKFKSVNFRSKAKGWGQYVIQIGLDKTEQFISNRTNDEFYTLFFSDLLLNTSCYDCKLRSTLEYTDIRLGDFWGKMYLGDKDGVSAVSVVSTNGKILFDEIKNKIKYRRHTYDDFLPYQSYGKTYQINNNLRKLAIDKLYDKDLNLRDVIKFIYKNQSRKQKIKRILTSLVNIMPQSIVIWMKRLYYNLL